MIDNREKPIDEYAETTTQKCSNSSALNCYAENEQPEKDEVIKGVVEPMPSVCEYWQTVGRYTHGIGPWFGAGLHRHKIEAEGDAANCGYKESKLVRIILPA